MKLETIGSVSMGDLTFQTFGQVDDSDSFEWTFLNTHCTSNTKNLTDECHLTCLLHFNTLLASSHHWAVSVALELTFLRFAFVLYEDSNTGFRVIAG